MLEIDLELIPLDGGDRAVAELAVENALANRHVGAALVSETYRRRAGLDHSLRLRVEAPVAAGALPARATCAGAHRLRWAGGGERVSPLRPLRPPQALAAGHG